MEFWICTCDAACKQTCSSVDKMRRHQKSHHEATDYQYAHCVEDEEEKDHYQVCFLESSYCKNAIKLSCSSRDDLVSQVHSRIARLQQHHPVAVIPEEHKRQIVIVLDDIIRYVGASLASMKELRTYYQ